MSRQVAGQIRQAIADGLLRPGDPLPSTRVLARRLGLVPMAKWRQLLRMAGCTVVPFDVADPASVPARLADLSPAPAAVLPDAEPPVPAWPPHVPGRAAGGA
ncbi:MAG TPA: GntR family transcriptional regulator [Trebonia sp.]